MGNNRVGCRFLLNKVDQLLPSFQTKQNAFLFALLVGYVLH